MPKKIDIKITQKKPNFIETGSCFDVTQFNRLNNLKTRPGGHEGLPKKPLDVSSFSYNRITERKTTDKFTKKGSGFGGTLVKPKREPDTTTEFIPEENVAKSPDKLKRCNRALNFAAYAERSNPPNTNFRFYYERGELPVQIEHGVVHNRVRWKVPIEILSFSHYLPLFFHGLREVEEPYAFLAECGVYDMLGVGGRPGKVLPVLRELIMPIRTALNTRNRVIIVKVLKVLQRLATCDVRRDDGDQGQETIPGDNHNSSIGQELKNYYRQILPVLNTFIRQNRNLGDGMDYKQRFGGDESNVGELIMDTLEIFERYGGPQAFINIKYLVPTYESVIFHH